MEYSQDGIKTGRFVVPVLTATFIAARTGANAYAQLQNYLIICADEIKEDKQVVPFQKK